MKCSKCGNEVASGDVFCGECGTKISYVDEGVKSKEKTICPNCKSVWDKDAKFCGNCGNKFTETSPGKSGLKGVEIENNKFFTRAGEL